MTRKATPKKSKRADEHTTPIHEKRAVEVATTENEQRAATFEATTEKARATDTVPPTTPPRSPEQSRIALKKKVRFFYDIQRLKLQCQGRLLKRPTNVTIDLHEDDQVLLEKRFKELERAEKDLLKDVEAHLKTLPLYTKVLSDKVRYRGIGPTMAGVIMAEFDIGRLDTVSKMWAFAGLRPMPCYRCKTCSLVVEDGPEEEGSFPFRHPKPAGSKCQYAGHLLMDDYVFASGKAQKPTKGEKLPYNAWLRTKLVGVLGPVLIKLNSPWRKFYDDYKHRKASAGWGVSDGHRHNAAVRYMIKMLLLDIWREWRQLEGLPVRPPYAEEYLGKVHHSATVWESSMQEKRARKREEPTRLQRTEDEDAEIAAEVELVSS